MVPELSISGINGSIQIAGCAIFLAKGISKDAVLVGMSAFCRSLSGIKSDDEWLKYSGVNFGGLPCEIFLQFGKQSLIEVSLSVTMPGATLEGGWPTREDIDQEISFMRGMLSNQLGRSFEVGIQEFPWGVAYSVFEERGFCVNSGLRYF